jgi:hypothetical protein
VGATASFREVAPPGSNQSSSGGNETAEASDLVNYDLSLFDSLEFASPVCQCVPRFFVTARSLKLLSSKTVARLGSSAPLISNSQFWPTFFTLPREL